MQTSSDRSRMTGRPRPAAPRAWALTAACLGLGAVLGAGLGGCVERNARLDVGRVVDFETFDAQPRELALGPGEPSANALMERPWKETTVVVPVDGTSHLRTFRIAHDPVLRNHGRQRGEFPTIESAPDLQRENRQARMGEAIFHQGLAAVEALAIPVRLVLRPPPQVRERAYPAYDRASEHTRAEAERAAGVTPGDEPAAPPARSGVPDGGSR